MTYDDVIKHFKTQTLAAEAIGVNQSTVANWKMRGQIPKLQQLKISTITAGKLKLSKATKAELRLS